MNPTTLRSSVRAATSIVSVLALALAAGCAAGGDGESVSSTADAITTANIAAIARDNVGKGACSTNSEGGKDFDSSCTGNGGEPEYWCADFARWVWGQAGVDTSGLTAAAGSFYTYGEDHSTIHTKPAVGDAVVFDYQGHGVADHVAIVVEVNSDGTIETVSGDWGGDGSSEAGFSSTSHVDLNAPAYAGVVGSKPKIMDMTISGFIAPAGTSGGSSSAGTGSTGTAECYSATLGKDVSHNACVQSAEDDRWYECKDGNWTTRDTDPTACNGTYPLANGGHSSGGGKVCYSSTEGKDMPDNACVQAKSDSQWYQCDDGKWTYRWTDPTGCSGVYPL